MTLNTYQVVSTQRTASTLVNKFAISHNKIGYNEFFLGDYKLINNQIVKVSKLLRPAWSESYTAIKNKFEYLEQQKKENKHYSIKIFPYQLICLGFTEQIYNYLKDYKIITINRPCFDSFLSNCYKKATKGRFGHITINDIPEIVEFTISKKEVNYFLNRWLLERNFISTLNPITLNYSDLTIPYLQSLFNTDYVPSTIPINLNYECMVTNLYEIKEYFNNRLKNLLQNNNIN